MLDWTLESEINETRLPKRFLIMDILMFGISSILGNVISCPLNFTNVFLEPKLTDFSREQSLINCFVPRIELQLQVSQSTDTYVLVFQEHPADIPRGF